MTQRVKQIVIIAGEASGDAHAAELVRSVKLRAPEVHFSGVGGTLMRNEGVEILVDSAQITVVGLLEIIPKLKDILRAKKKIANHLKELKPDLLILVDFPGFNLRIAKIAKHYGIKVLYYISPQIWAWHKSRIKIIKKYVDRMAVILPFEENFYLDNNISAQYVGNPLVQKVKPSLDKEQARKAFGIKADTCVIGLLPGSRSSEIERMLPLFLQMAKNLQNQMEKVEFILPIATTIDGRAIRKMVDKEDLPIHYVNSSDLYNAVQLCDVAVAASGTVTLEVALLGIPLIVAYKLSALTYWIARCLVNIKYISLCNIVAEMPLAKEFIQNEATAEHLSREVLKIIEDEAYRSSIQDKLVAMKEKLQNSKTTISIENLTLGMI